MSDMGATEDCAVALPASDRVSSSSDQTDVSPRGSESGLTQSLMTLRLSTHSRHKSQLTRTKLFFVYTVQRSAAGGVLRHFRPAGALRTNNQERVYMDKILRPD